MTLSPQEYSLKLLETAAVIFNGVLSNDRSRYASNDQIMLNFAALRKYSTEQARLLMKECGIEEEGVDSKN